MHLKSISSLGFAIFIVDALLSQAVQTNCTVPACFLQTKPSWQIAYIRWGHQINVYVPAQNVTTRRPQKEKIGANRLSEFMHGRAHGRAFNKYSVWKIWLPGNRVTKALRHKG